MGKLPGEGCWGQLAPSSTESHNSLVTNQAWLDPGLWTHSSALCTHHSSEPRPPPRTTPLPRPHALGFSKWCQGKGSPVWLAQKALCQQEGWPFLPNRSPYQATLVWGDSCSQRRSWPPCAVPILCFSPPAVSVHPQPCPITPVFVSSIG